MKKIASELKKARLERKLSYWKAGQLASLTIGQIQRIEKGENTTTDVLEKYAKVFDKTITLS